MMLMQALKVVPVFCLMLAGCGDRTESPASEGLDDQTLPVPAAEGVPAGSEGRMSGPSASAPSPGSLSSPAEWTIGVVRRQHQPDGVATLAAARLARNEGFDRIVLEFEGDELPSYHVEYIDRPVRQCGSGDPVPIEGDGWLAIRMQPARAHDDRGSATVEARAIRPALPIVREARLICDFEAHLDWVLGVSSPNHFRVVELGEPSRLVVDVRH
jgi:hypothetical protein